MTVVSSERPWWRQLRGLPRGQPFGLRQRRELDSPDGEHYIVKLVRWVPPSIGAGGLVSVVVGVFRWGRWRVIVERIIQGYEFRRRWLPFASRWHGPGVRAQDAQAEFDRVVKLLESGAWPDPTYVQR